MFFKNKKDYRNKPFSAEASLDDIYWCFRLILGRPPHEEEWLGHTSLAGRPLEDVVRTYLTSTEFKARSLDYIDVSSIKQVEMPGFNMFVPSNDPQVGVHIYENRVYESHITEFIRKHLRTGQTFLDLGANIGYFTSLAASIVGEAGRVMSVEPGTSNLKFLLLNKQLNQFDQVDIFPAAASDEKALMLYDSSGSNGFTTSIGQADAGNDLTRILGSDVVNAITVDDICSSLDRLDMIKVDIEGAEYRALKGAMQTVRKHRPMIISEFSPPALDSMSNATAEEFLELMLADTDYEISCFTHSGLVQCERDAGKVIQQFNQAQGDHIDIVFALPGSC